MENLSHLVLLGSHFMESLCNDTCVIVVVVLTSLKCYKGILGFACYDNLNQEF